MVIAAWFVGSIIGVYIIGPLMVTIIFVVSFAGNFLIIHPIAWMLEHPKIDKLVKTFSVILLTVGFHFDLLAS